MRTTFDATLDLLDEGLYLYRRGFVPLVLLTAIGVVPLVLFFVLLIYADSLPFNAGIGLLIGLLAIIIFPIGIYAVGSISRATVALVNNEALDLRALLRIQPLRIVGTGCYGGIFLTVVNTLVSMLSLICACPIYIFMVAFVFAPLSLVGTSGFSEPLFGVIFTLISIGTVLIYGGSFVVSGATFCSLILSIQPFSQETLRFGQSIQRSLDITTYKLGQNVVIWLCASLVFGAIAIAVTLAIGAIVPLPLFLALGEESLITQGVSAAAWLIGMTLALPPLPIWMALLYRRRVALRDATELEVRIAQLERAVAAEQGS